MRIIVIDDNPDHRELVTGKVRRAFPDAEFVQVSRRADLERAFAGPEPNLVLTDYRLNWTTGLDVLRQVREMHPWTPVVMVTDTGSEEIATEGMKSGLSDYVLKSHLHRLPIVVKESLEKTALRREHEAALERLRVSEERYRAVSELCSDYAYSLRVEPDGSFVREWITHAFTRITGYDVDALEAGVLLPIVHPEDRHVVAKGREILRAAQPFVAEVRIVTRSGEVIWLRDYARPVWDVGQGRVVRVFGAGQDITVRKRAEDERAQLIREQVARAETEASERRYRILAEAIPQIVWTARPDGWLDYFNQRWYEYSGMSFEETKGWAWKKVLHPDDVATCLESWTHSMVTGETYECEYRFRRGSDGSYRWHLGRALPVRDENGRITSWFGTSTDIDDRRRSEEELRQAQKLESIGLLAGGIAHDFNNLLTGILGNTSLALAELDNDHKIRGLLDDVVRASERAADLTRQLLAYSGKGRFYVQPIDLSNLVRDISTLIRTSIPKKVELQLHLEENLPSVEADSTQIQQLIMNLVINGAEAIGDSHGVVLVSTALQDIDDDYLRSHHFASNGIEPGCFVTIEVRDTGCGMDEAVQSQIFDPFFTTKFTGRGLGMSAALGIVRGHKGAILIESAPGKGSTFRILLPAAAAEAKKQTAPDYGRNLRGEGTILVVDDEEVVRQAARNALERFGYRVLLAENGERGVETFDRLAGEISLVLLDMTMPVMSGEEALERIKARRADIPVIASSGYNESVAIERFGGKGLAGFIQKPYTAARLAQMVRQIAEARVRIANS
jgi:PAS domain S-box-containing protein